MVNHWELGLIFSIVVDIFMLIDTIIVLIPL